VRRCRHPEQQEILNNQGSAQLMDVMEAHISAAEQELEDVVDASLHSAGTGFGGKELGGLQLAIPTTTNAGTYGGISRVSITPSGAPRPMTPTRYDTTAARASRRSRRPRPAVPQQDHDGAVPQQAGADLL
jgi:hypothetical protein